jgi:hypothetical protein
MLGPAPLGYVVAGTKYRKTLAIDPVWGPVVRGAFERIADGETRASVTRWLAGKLGKSLRVKFTTDMIQRRTYLGERDGVTFPALVTQEQWDDANAAMASRSFARGRNVEQGYSVYCACGTRYYHHQSSRNGKPTGQAKYRCGRGRGGNLAESRCEHGAPIFSAVNDAVDRLMRHVDLPERVMVTSGGDHGRQMELARIKGAMAAAMGKGDMAAVATLAAEFSAVDSQPAKPIVTSLRLTGRTYADVWTAGTVEDRRAMLARGEFRIMAAELGGRWVVSVEFSSWPAAADMPQIADYIEQVAA